VSAETGRDATPRPISREIAASLRIPWSSLLSRQELEEHVERYPHASWYVPGTNSYLVAGPWRRRDDIVEVLETHGDSHRAALWDALLGGGAFGAVLVDPSEFRTAPDFYHARGVRPLEDVLVLRTSALPGPAMRADIEMSRARKRALRDVMALDAAAFPWLWRNSRAEFEDYLATPGVQIWTAYREGRTVGYIGFTDLGGWGHVDRIAVEERERGQGYGASLLGRALYILHDLGARYVQLSTQSSNEQSLRLYRRFGFKPARGGYRLQGRYLTEPR
jgi:ribosomal protein S18 acetylase RimI-like enzyme